MALKVEGVVDGSVHAQKALGGAAHATRQLGAQRVSGGKRLHLRRRGTQAGRRKSLCDSPLEEDGFEPSVRRRRRVAGARPSYVPNQAFCRCRKTVSLAASIIRQRSERRLPAQRPVPRVRSKILTSVGTADASQTGNEYGRKHRERTSCC